MDDVLRLRIKELKTTRVVTRSGDVSTITNLDMVSLESARSVIILASCDDTDNDDLKASSDAKAIQTVLATMGNEIENDEFSVVVEIFNPTHREIVRSSFPDHVITVNTSDILAKLLVQTSRSVGLSVVYNEILSFDGCEMYFYDAEWNNATFGEIAYRFPDGVPMGIRNGDGDISMNPESSRRMQPNDEILILADDDSTIELLAEPVAQPGDLKLSGVRQQQRVERELMVGWSFKSPAIIREFADYIIEGSRIDVLLKRPHAGAGRRDQGARQRNRRCRSQLTRQGLPEHRRPDVDQAVRVRQHHYPGRRSVERGPRRRRSHRFGEHRCVAAAAANLQPVSGRKPKHQVDYGSTGFAERCARRESGRPGCDYFEPAREHDYGADFGEPGTSKRSTTTFSRKMGPRYI